MRRVLMTALAAAATITFVTPASAKAPVLPSACSITATTANAVACSGYYTGNLLGGDSAKVALQNTGLQAIGYTGTVTTSNFGDFTSLGSTSLNGSGLLSFGQTLFGIVYVGLHAGGGAGGGGTVFYKFDFGTGGSTGITLSGFDLNGFSTLSIYGSGQPGSVPEAATWAMMLLGFGGIGMAMRRSKRRAGALMQVA